MRALYLLLRAHGANVSLLVAGVVAGTGFVIVDLVADAMAFLPAVRGATPENVATVRTLLDVGHFWVGVALVLAAAFAVTQGMMLAQSGALGRFVSWVALVLGCYAAVVGTGALIGVSELAVGSDAVESLFVGYIVWAVATGVSLVRRTRRPDEEARAASAPPAPTPA